MPSNIETQCIHGDLNFDFNEQTHAVSFPIYQTATFGHIGIGHSSGFDYTREKNPTRQRLEEIVTALEGAYDTTAFSSGMAAASACFELFSHGDHIICSEDLYGGVVRLFNTISKKNGIEVDYVDTSITENILPLINKNTKALYIETPSNPMMNITDLHACAKIAKENNLLLIVDNTFLSPYLQNPIAIGADLVIHSGSKFLSGHNDTISGFLCSASEELASRVKLIAKTTGATLAPFDSWLVMRGIKTLSVRMERAQSNAKSVAKWLQTQPKIKNVFYAGLETHKGYEINSRQARGAGSMISFHTNSVETAHKILEKVRLITFAESLGGAESLITYPMMQTHPDVPKDVREHLGITETLLRMSVGIENVEDIIADLLNAMGED